LRLERWAHEAQDSKLVSPRDFTVVIATGKISRSANGGRQLCAGIRLLRTADPNGLEAIQSHSHGAENVGCNWMSMP
jgi:hypothetical protein